MPVRTIPLLMLVVLGLAWGGHFSLLKIAALSGLPHLTIIVLTTYGVIAGMFVISTVRRRLPPVSWRHFRFYGICAVLGYLSEFPLSLLVAEKIPAGLLTIVASTSPVFTSLIAIMFRIERVSARRAIAIALGLTAAALVLVPGTALPQPDLLPWVALAFAMPVLYATYHNYVAVDWPEDCDSWQVAFGEAVTAGIIITGYYIASQGLKLEVTELPPGSWAIAAMAALAIIEIYLYFEIVRRAGPVFVSLGGLISIVAGVAWGMAIFGEQHNSWIWASTVLLGLSLYFARDTAEAS